MKVVHLSKRDYVGGGAARAASRLNNSLAQNGLESMMLVGEKHLSDDSIFQPTRLNQRLRLGVVEFIDQFRFKKNYPEHKTKDFSTNLFPNITSSVLSKFKYDILHVHWVGNGFFPIVSLPKIAKPIVWTLHDSWPFTGGCHVPSGCQKFKANCGQCPALSSTKSNDLSRRIYLKKKEHWSKVKINWIAPSRWMATKALESSLLGNQNVKIIGNALDTELFKPRDKTFARRLFNLSESKKIILFGSVSPLSDPNKGFELLRKSLEKLQTTTQEVQLVIFGTEKKPDSLPGNDVKAVGWIRDELLMSALYSAADLTLVPSYYESFGQIVTESMACGTPVIAFDASGPSDIIGHRATGYLAKAFDPDDFARGIEWVLDHPDPLQLSQAARRAIEENYSFDVIAKKHIDLYSQLL